MLERIKAYYRLKRLKEKHGILIEMCANHFAFELSLIRYDMSDYNIKRARNNTNEFRREIKPMIYSR